MRSRWLTSSLPFHLHSRRPGLVLQSWTSAHPQRALLLKSARRGSSSKAGGRRTANATSGRLRNPNPLDLVFPRVRHPWSRHQSGNQDGPSWKARIEAVVRLAIVTRSYVLQRRRCPHPHCAKVPLGLVRTHPHHYWRSCSLRDLLDLQQCLVQQGHTCCCSK